MHIYKLYSERICDHGKERRTNSAYASKKQRNYEAVVAFRDYMRSARRCYGDTDLDRLDSSVSIKGLVAAQSSKF